LDSTLLDDAVATQDTVTQLVSMIRRVRKAIAAAAVVEVAAHDYDAVGKPRCAWDDPAARDELVTGLVNDALAILAAVDGVDLDADQQRLVGLLALVAGQDVEEGDEPGSWRIARKVAHERVISTSIRRPGTCTSPGRSIATGQSPPRDRTGHRVDHRCRSHPGQRARRSARDCTAR
jgi:hypothetical protein